ncbi:MAG: CoA transferase [Deltaproteobacteria bacterium]|jgi:crotonobetainyl-CoA:carnitine CoA-transferase CaiB-like acyl-CoA transferase|nr:CoA transferase [Deltaproteobacteria bacterium]MBW2499142.1 CoA transferase [Deltaproteobacteria bacterium]
MKPLEGIRVLDVTRIVSGPTCCFHLAALGAEVIRVEGPGGDVTWNVPPFVGPDGAHRGPRGPRDIALSPLRRGRGKRSIEIDIKCDAGQDLLRRLAARSDVLVENFRPGVMQSFGLDFASLEAVNPRLVYCSITGYGHDGPYRNWPSMDLVVQAASGLMAKTGFTDGPPTKVGAMIGDQVPGIYAALGIVSALRQRDLDGRGQWIDVAMLDSLIALLWDEPLDDFEREGIPERVGNGDPRGGPIGTYRTSDGWIAMVCVGDKPWEKIASLIGREDMIERWPRMHERGEHREEIDAAVDAWTSRQTTREAVDRLTAIGVAAGPVQSPWSGRRDPQVLHRGALEPLQHPDLEGPSEYWGPALPIRMSRSELRPAPAEVLGSSTDAVLRELLGLSDAELDTLHRDGVVGRQGG